MLKLYANLQLAVRLSSFEMWKSDKPPQEVPQHPVFNDPKVRTINQDARYHNMNATKWCFATFVDYKRCQRLLGEKSDCCPQFEKIYKALCPHAWVESWEHKIKEGTFPVDLPEQRRK